MITPASGKTLQPNRSVPAEAVLGLCSVRMVRPAAATASSTVAAIPMTSPLDDSVGRSRTSSGPRSTPRRRGQSEQPNLSEHDLRDVGPVPRERLGDPATSRPRRRSWTGPTPPVDAGSVIPTIKQQCGRHAPGPSTSTWSALSALCGHQLPGPDMGSAARSSPPSSAPMVERHGREPLDAARGEVHRSGTLREDLPSGTGLEADLRPNGNDLSAKGHYAGLTWSRASPARDASADSAAGQRRRRS